MQSRRSEAWRESEALRLRYAAQADAWCKAQARRLRVEPADVLRAIASGILPDKIAALSAIAFTVALAGRSLSPTDVGVLKSLRRAREWWSQDRLQGVYRGD